MLLTKKAKKGKTMKTNEKTDSLPIFAVCDGVVEDISGMADEVFSSRMLGDGYAIKPRSSLFFSPVSGRIMSVSSSSHAFTIHTESGFDILVHIGIDTVRLKDGEISPLVSRGEDILVGTPIARADLDAIRAHSLDTTTAVVVTTSPHPCDYSLFSGDVLGGRDIAMVCKRRKEGE